MKTLLFLLASGALLALSVMFTALTISYWRDDEYASSVVCFACSVPVAFFGLDSLTHFVRRAL